jgi:WD40 repeat protein
MIDTNGSTASPPARAASPYIGLSYYTEAEAEWFFGRGDECQTIIGNLRAARLTVLYASSGVGKSSLLRAGVARECRELARRQLAERGAARYVPVVFGAWRDEPVEDLISAIERAVRAVLPAGASVQLPREGLTAAIQAATAALDAKLLIILDQFEEYFLYNTNEHAGQRLADELAAAVNSVELRANFLIAIREDAYAGLGDLFAGKLANVFGNYLQLEYLDRDAARETIVKPIAHFNQLHAQEPAIEIEPQLVEAVLDQVRTGELLAGQSAPGTVEHGNGARADRDEIETPYLQLVMSNLWAHERARGSHVLRLATLTELGGAREIMRTHLDGALEALDADEYETALELFHYLVTPSGTKIAFAASDLAQLVEKPYKQVAGLLAKLAAEDTRILRHVPPPAGKSQPADRYELFHDVLAPAVIDWRRRALEQRKRANDARERERLEREKHEAEERAREEARRRRAFQQLAIGALALLLIAALLGVLALLAQRRAVSNLHTAQASQLLAGAEQTLSSKPELSTLLALRALRVKHTTQAEKTLREALPRLQELQSLHVGAAVDSAVFSPDGTKILTAGENGTASIWDLASGKQLQVLKGHAGSVENAAFNRAGSEVVTADKDGTAIVWDLASGKPVHVLDGHAGTVNRVAFSPDGTKVVTANKGGTAIVWDLSSGDELNVLPTGAGGIESAAFSPDGSEIVTANENGDAAVWDAESGKQLQLFPGGVGSVEGADFSPDGTRVVTAGGDGTAIVWDAHSGQRLVPLNVSEGAVLGAAFNPSGSEVVTADQNGTAIIWNAETGKQLVVLSGDEGPVRSAAFSANGKEVVTASADGTARIWDAFPRQLSKVLPDDAGDVLDAAFSHDGTKIVTANQNHTADIWDASDGKRLQVLNAPKGPVLTAAFNRDGTEVVTANADGDAIIWNAGSGERLHVLPGSPRTVFSAAFSPDGTKVVTANKNGTAIVWDAQSGERLQVLPSDAGSVERAAFSPDGTNIVTANENGTASIWNAAGGKPPHVLHVSAAPVLSVAFSADGTKLVTAGRDGAATIWDVDSGKRLMTLPGSGGPIYSAAFGPGGREVMTANGDGEVKIWDWAARKQLTVLSGHKGTVFGAAFSPDGSELVTANEDATATIWSTELAGTLPSLERIAERRAPQTLTPAEQIYLAG